jgi:hypothetical protein
MVPFTSSSQGKAGFRAHRIYARPHSAKVVGLAQKFNSIIAVTDPSWVSKASRADCLTVLHHLSGAHGNGQQRRLN